LRGLAAPSTFTASGPLRNVVATGMLKADVNEDRIADMQIPLSADSTLSCDDFILQD
jgi:hypothetical protein